VGEESRESNRARMPSRRDFVRWSAAAGIAGTFTGMGVLSALGYVKGPQEPPPAWQVEPGVVDYGLVPEGPSGPDPHVLKIAQWYDYWPGTLLEGWVAYMKEMFELRVDYRWDIYTSNEELFHWLTLSKRRYDVIFPSNYLVDLMKKADMIYTLNPEWLPNLGPDFSNMFQDLVNTPAEDPYDRRRVDGEMRWVSVPYQWGTTGLGFRTDRISREDAVELGYDVLWMAEFRTLDLRKRMRMLDDMRDVLGAGLKKAGWEWQSELGVEPTGLYPPDGIQWTTNETDPARLNAAGTWLRRNKPLLFGYTSTDQATSLLSGGIVNQVWSGDVMYAIQPNAATPQPVDYIIPRQGSTWWVDCAAIHSKSRNLWLAHQFLNYLHEIRPHRALTKWNMYSTPNRAAYDTDDPNQPWEFPNGYDTRDDPRLYPNRFAPAEFRVCDPSRDVGLATLLRLYNPIWFDLAAT